MAHISPATRATAPGTHDQLPQPRRRQVAATSPTIVVILAALLATWVTMTVLSAIMLGTQVTIVVTDATRVATQATMTGVYALLLIAWAAMRVWKQACRCVGYNDGDIGHTVSYRGYNDSHTNDK